MRALSTQELNAIGGGIEVVQMGLDACQSRACNAIVLTSTAAAGIFSFGGLLASDDAGALFAATVFATLGAGIGMLVSLPIGLAAEGIVRAGNYIFS